MRLEATVQSVQVNVDIPKAAGGTYKGAILSYTESNGKQGDAKFNSRYIDSIPAIKASLHALLPGDRIAITKEKQGNFWNVTNIEKIAVPAAGVAAKQAPATNAFNDSRQESIVYQSSRANAVALVTTMLEHNMIELPAKAKNKDELVIAYVERLASRFAKAAIAPTFMQEAAELEVENAEDEEDYE